MKTVTRTNGDLVAVSRSGFISITDEFGREREHYKLPYGAVISAKDGATVQARPKVAAWDPHTHPIVAEVAGKMEFVGMEEGITINRQTDDLTGLSNIEVIDPKDRPAAGKDIRPMVKLVDAKGNEVLLPGSHAPLSTYCLLMPWLATTTATKWAWDDILARVFLKPPQATRTSPGSATRSRPVRSA